MKDNINSDINCGVPIAYNYDVFKTYNNEFLVKLDDVFSEEINYN